MLTKLRLQSARGRVLSQDADDDAGQRRVTLPFFAFLFTGFIGIVSFVCHGFQSPAVMDLGQMPSAGRMRSLRKSVLVILSMPNRKRVLFLCTGNSCRSQMAEGFLRELYGDRYESLSAGTSPAGYVHSNAVAAMKQCGIDVSNQVSKDISDYLPPEGSLPDLIVGVCSSAAENCPVFPAVVEHRHWPFDDPADATGTDEQVMAEFVRVRDEIREKLELEFGS
jgi:arsenate reductase (thioredoxin)